MDKIDLHRKMIHDQEEKPKVEKAIQLVSQKVELSAYRNERNLMLYPFCSTARKTRFTSIKYKTSDGKRWLTVSPNVEYGMAKIWDFDVLRYALSKAGEIARMEGATFPPYVEFSAYECLKALKKTDSKKNYEWLEAALDRLASTTYSGNIFREEERTKETFTLLSVKFISGDDGIERIRINFNERLIESARYYKGLLEIDPRILKEDSGLKKRLLELVKTGMGRNSDWTVGLVRLQELCAHEGELKKFKRQIKSFKDISWEISFSPKVGGGENVTFIKKE